ncbi:MAG TPA: hypothetical protein VEN81_15240 [Planctomycetota bacterium]|nr:hypothetical protein [Planctomycetota bacterium]
MTELDEIALEYRAGRLEAIKVDLERFLLAHRGEIAACRAEQERTTPGITEADAVKLFILRHRSIHPAHEIRDQLEEIQKEKWIRGIQSGCAPDAQQVAVEWARAHSAAWRQHRLTTVLYVFDQEQERYLKLLG